MTIHEHLRSLGACKDARIWAAQYNTAQEVWDNCTRIGWLFWWAEKCGQHEKIILVAKEIADSVKHLKSADAAYAAAYADAAADADAATYAAVAAAYAAADADADAATYAAVAAAAAVAADAAADADAAAAYAADAAAAYAAQNSLNMLLARKHLTCPWHE